MSGWRVIHLAVFAQWMGLLSTVLNELLWYGHLTRTANDGGQFETSFVVWVVALLAMTLASAVRAYLLEDRA